MEEWKQIPGMESYYVSTLGNVKSRLYNKERILKPFMNGEYLGIWLGAGNKHKIHRLVASVFLGYNDNMMVDHINRNKHDNKLSNLRWVTASQNSINSCCSINNILKQKNISRHKSGMYWVRIYRNGKYSMIESFNNLNEAIIARDNFINAE